MKKQLLFRLALVALFLGLIPISCIEKDPCHDLKNQSSRANIKSLVAQWQIRHIFSRIDPFHTEAWDDVALDVYVKDYEFVISTKRSPLVFSETLFACSPTPPHSVEKVTGINIISNVDFSMSQAQKYFSGDTINEIFHHEQFREKTLEEAFVGKILWIESNQIFLREKPEKTIEMDIDVIVQLNNQDIYTFKNLEAKIK